MQLFEQVAGALLMLLIVADVFLTVLRTRFCVVWSTNLRTRLTRRRAICGSVVTSLRCADCARPGFALAPTSKRALKIT